MIRIKNISNFYSPLHTREQPANQSVATTDSTPASLGITAPVVAEDTASDTTIHAESPRPGTGVSVGSDPNAVHHNRGEADDATGDDRMNMEDGDNVDASGSVPGADEAVHTSAYRKTHPEEPEVSELDE